MDSEEDVHEEITDQDHVMGESGCTLTVLDVAEILQARYAYISGGKARNGSPIITFPDNPGADEVTEQQYKRVVSYLSSIPTLQDIDAGFVLVIDRRRDKWGSVKTMLLRISGFFPGLVQEVYVLRPSGFFQRTIADVGYKFVKDDFKFKVWMLTTAAELHEHIDKDQLTPDLDGTSRYNHKEWIQHRAAIEKFSANTVVIGQTLKDLCQRYQELEFPNDVVATEQMIQDHEQEHKELKEDLKNTRRHGEVLLSCFKRAGDGETELPSSELSADRLAHVTACERLLVQLEETELNFDDFWCQHDSKLQQCLQLRCFEEEFKQLQFGVERHLVLLSGMTDPGDSLHRVENYIKELKEFEEHSTDDMMKAEQLRMNGEQFMENDHYAVDCIRPKCIELQRMCEQYKELVRQRHQILAKSRELHDRIDKANKWCTRGVDLLATQQIEKCTSPEGAEVALHDITSFLQSAHDLKLDNPKEFRTLYDSVVTPDTKTTVTQVLQRMEDVQGMCEKRRDSLKRLMFKPKRPVQPVTPEPIQPPPRSPSENEIKHKMRKQRSSSIDRSGKIRVEIMREDSATSQESLETENSNFLLHSPGGTTINTDILHAKRGHVMNEVIESERVYVAELQSILQGYLGQMDNPALQDLIPPELRAGKAALFSNMAEIYRFHKVMFLKDLENCRHTPALVGRCFVDRREEFQMYSIYCQNKPQSEAVRRQVGDNAPYFKECQRRLNHKLPLGAYLLKPVQRITKYQLLLKEMLKYSTNEEGCNELKEALDAMLSVLKYVNDVMHSDAITGFNGNIAEQGRLLMQGSFSMWTEHQKGKIKDLRFKPMQRHIFLYENIVLFCKKKEDAHHGDNAVYLFKNSLATANIGLTENVKGDKRKFELWLHGRTEVFIIQAPNLDVKESWVAEIKKVLMMQFGRLKEREYKEVPTVPILKEVESIPIYQQTSQRLENSANNNDSVTVNMSPSEEERDSDAGWSSGEFSDDDVTDNSRLVEQIERQQYIVLADYHKTDAVEISLHEGEVVEVMKVGNEGWWYVHCLDTSKEGWAPASYLQTLKRRSSQSTTSSSSLESGGASAISMRTATSRSSVNSLPCHLEETMV